MSMCKMKVGPLVFEFDGDNHQELFEQIARTQEVFDNKCTRCDNDEVRFILRTDDEDNKYYEMQCTNPNCRAKLAFGCNKKGGGMFPKRKDKEGNMVGKWGWGIWNPETKEVE